MDGRIEPARLRPRTNDEARTGRASSRICWYFFQLRAGPPTVGVRVRAIIVGGRHEAPRDWRAGGRKHGGGRGHGCDFSRFRWHLQVPRTGLSAD